jgi:hypothetical protein
MGVLSIRNALTVVDDKRPGDVTLCLEKDFSVVKNHSKNLSALKLRLPLCHLNEMVTSAVLSSKQQQNSG